MTSGGKKIADGFEEKSKPCSPIVLEENTEANTSCVDKSFSK